MTAPCHTVLHKQTVWSLNMLSRSQLFPPGLFLNLKDLAAILLVGRAVILRPLLDLEAFTALPLLN